MAGSCASRALKGGTQTLICKGAELYAWYFIAGFWDALHFQEASWETWGHIKTVGEYPRSRYDLRGTTKQHTWRSSGSHQWDSK